MKRSFGSIKADAFSEAELYKRVQDAVTGSTPCLLSYANAHNVTLAEDDATYRDALSAFTIVFPEGEGMALAARILNYPDHEKFHTTDFWGKLLPYFRTRRVKLYLLGSTDTTLEKATERFIKEGINITGSSDGFTSVQNSKKLIEDIRKATPDVLLVGMGVPKQEHWVADFAPQLSVPLIICVGNYFEFYAGTVRRAPRYFSSLGFEWLYRMLSEPRRLWKRYLLGIPRFLRIIIRQRRQRTL
jgi:N-acetylglucosaminyldiphosphoundecaprenol N-acetyl-beta-D-mannosaminyltransferase